MLRTIPICLMLTMIGGALHAQAETKSFTSALTPYVEYSDTSSHILLGIAQNRRLAAAGVEYTRRLLQRKKIAWDYTFDLRPVMFLQDPVSTTTQTVQFSNQNKPYGPFLIQQGPIQRSCQSATYTDPISHQGNATIVDTRVCDTRWTYAGGVSPLGQELVFLPARRLEPLIVGNAGIVVATRDVPADDSSAVNFTFEFGVGLRLIQSRSHALSLDYRIRHLSNRALGNNNPGIDNQILRFSYMYRRGE